MAVSRIFCATGLIGGTDGDLDTIDGQNLADKDMAIAIDQTTAYIYALDADSGASESSPDVISPDTNAGNKRWILQSIRVNDLTVSDDIILATDDVKIGDTLEVVGATQFGDADGTGANVTFYSNTSGDHMVYDATAKTFTLTDVSIATAGTGTITSAGVLSVDDTTETTSGTTGSIHTDGGLGVAKDIYIGDDLLLASANVINWAAGDITLTHSAAKLTWGGDGAVEIDFNNHEMTNVDIDSGAIDGVTIGGASAGAGTFTTITGSGVLSIDDTTETTSGITGSIHTDGGLGVAKDIFCGDDLLFASGAVVNWDSGDITLTHSAAKLTLGGDGAVEIDFNNHEMTNVDINSGAIDGTTIGAAATSTIIGTTIDATTDFTVGGLVITSNTLTASGNLTVEANDALVVKDEGNDVARIYIGEAASHSGELIVYGDHTGSTTGGEIYIHTADDHDGAGITYFEISASGDDLRIGPSQLPAALTFIGSGVDTTPWGNWKFDAPIDFNNEAMTNVDINSGAIDGTTIGAASASTIVGTTIDATTDFTVGGTVITDNTITDDGTLLLVPSTAVQVQGSGDLYVGTNNSLAGDVRIYGSATTGGVLRIYLDNDSDSTTDSWVFDAGTGTSLLIGASNDLDMLELIGGAAPSAKFNVALDVDAALTATTVDADTDFTVGGTVITDATITDDGVLSLAATTSVDVTGGGVLNVGVDNSTNGVLRLYGDAGSGGILNIYIENDFDTTNNFFRFTCPSGADDLHIGIENDLDMMIFHDSTSISTTVPFDVDAALTATTVDADTDFTVGSLVITDGVLTDATGLQLAAAVSITGALTVDSVTAYTADTNLTLAANGTGVIDINDSWNAAGQTCSDLGTVTTVDINGGSYDGGTLGAASAVTFTDLTGADTAEISLDSTPASDDTGTGIIVTETVDANATGIGAVLVKSSDGNWDEADADAVATVGQLGMALEAGTGSKKILLYGFIKDTAWSWTVGSQLFVHTTAGAMTHTAPSGSGDFVQVVGYAFASNTVFFNPSPDYIEVA